MDFVSGRKTGSKVRWKRIKAVLKRQPFLRRLKAAGARAGQLVRTGLVPGMTYGASVLGMPPSMLLQCRRIARSSCVNRTAGRSLGLDLALEPPRTDPAQEVLTRPIHVWSVALHDGWVPVGYFHRTLLEAVKTLSRVKNAWQAVRGPATALVCVLDPVRLVTHRGEINVATLSPGELHVLAREAHSRWNWNQARAGHPEFDGMDDPPLLDPLIRMVHGQSGGLSPQMRGNLRAAIVDGMWPQACRADAGWTDDARCQLCFEARGTNWHRCYECPALDHHRLTDGDPLALFRWAKMQPEWPLWTRCLLRDPTWDFPAPLMEDSITWVQRPPDGILEGRTFGDGSGINGVNACLCRCGLV